MSEPVQITIDQVQKGDTILIRRIENAGSQGEIISTIQGVAEELLDSRRGVRFAGSNAFYTIDDFNTITIIHRPPTRRAITLDDLKDWRSVPIGTRIELATEPFGKARAGKLTVRRETSESDEGWEFEVGGCWVQFSSIKPGTLFIIEEATP